MEFLQSDFARSGAECGAIGQGLMSLQPSTADDSRDITLTFDRQNATYRDK
ncbi:hypothetical protein HY36_02115 [Hyphomonas atlantica]|uniref:Uncharacterized protein n=1 Tax=Hyphomonas atlantica TaxID=1280948 RepID=A0A059EBX1_9PROT|nr:hypothetical protein HY36_02115 [Hyphomonas atlantica]